ncbi:hypothetical protein Cgig2_033601 [Carnegiea gigantea]|uniref:Crossover junction endonuclease EME1 n=1 Tax=Carnegiea gigantea TaxID=171969 RepID=A0A9Q1KQU1_9CARY|nr:hypothetical protein Cgig2_033601 [Carnegiea gigantea]
MSHPNPIQVELISDDEDDNVTSNSLKTPVSNHLKRPRSDFHSNSAPFFIIDDDPTPQKLRTSASSARSAVSEISFSDSPKTQDPQTLSCESKDVKDPSFGSSSLPRISSMACIGGGSDQLKIAALLVFRVGGWNVKQIALDAVGGLICLESDDENEKCPERGNWWKNIGRFAGFDEEKDLKASPRFAIRDKQWQNGEISAGFDEENNLEKSSADIDSVHYTDVAVHSNVHDDAEGSPAKGIGLRNEGRSDLNVQDYSAKKPDIALKESRKRKEVINADFDVECLEESLSVVKSSSLENRKPTSTYESIHLEDDADQLLPFHDLDHGTENVRLEADGVNCKRKSRGNANPQLKQNRNEKLTNRKKSEAEKARVMGEKKLKKQQDQLHKVALKAEAAKSRQLEKDKQRWEKECDKNILTEIDPKLASLETDVHYVLLIYGAEEFCKVALDGSLMDHISSVRNHYPSYTICCLTNRLMSYINKR